MSPKAESTTELKALPALPKISRAAKPKTNDCACGCGQKTASRFVAGHDSRLRGWMLRLERGIDVKGFITPGELKAAKEALEANGGHTPTHGKTATPVVTNVDRKLAKKQAREARKAARVAVETSEQTEATA